MSNQTQIRAPIKVFFFGDSICFGQGVSVHKTWVTRISYDLGDLVDKYGLEVSVTNSSINGNTTRQALERMPYDIQSHGIDFIVVQFGLNDCNCWDSDRGLPRVSPGAFEANLVEIVGRAFAFGARTIFLHTNHPTGRDTQTMPFTSITYEKNNAMYNSIIRRVSQSNESIVLIDIEQAFHNLLGKKNVLSSFLQVDLLHLSEEGHNLYYEIVSPAILKTVDAFGKSVAEGSLRCK